MKLKFIFLSTVVFLCLFNSLHSQTWQYVNTLQNEYLQKICTPDSNTVYIVGKNGLIAKSTDRAVTWNKQYSSNHAILNDIKFISTQVGFAVGEKGTILKTTNAGTNWIPQTSGTSININSIAFSDLNNIWAVGDSSLIIKSIDGGTSWSKIILIPKKVKLNDVAFRDTIGYIVGDTNVIFRTFNKGVNWDSREIGHYINNQYAHLHSLKITSNKTFFRNYVYLYSSSDNLDSSDEFHNPGSSFLLNDTLGYAAILNACLCDMNHPNYYFYKTINGGGNWGDMNLSSVDGIWEVDPKTYDPLSIYFATNSIGYILNGSILLRTPTAPGFTYRSTALSPCKSDTTDIIIRANSINLIVKSTQLPISTIELYSVDGNKVIFKSWNSSDAERSVDVSTLPKGVYIINVIFTDQSKTGQKWVKF